MVVELHDSVTAHWRVAVVMPAYNEDCLLDFLVEIEQHLLPVVRRIDFVVIDDASKTPVSQALQGPRDALRSPVNVVRNEVNLGHGPSALRAYAFGASLRPDVVVHVDGDGQFRGEDFPRLIRSLPGFDAAVGVRQRRTEPWFRKFLTTCLRWFVAPGSSGGDVNSPLRAYPREVVDTLLDEVAPSSLVPHIHWSRCEARLGLRVAAVPVESLPRRGSSPVGSSWGPARRRSWIPSRRLLAFATRATVEVLRGGGQATSASVRDAFGVEDAAV